MNFLHLYFQFFPESLGAVSDEPGKRFHQDIQAMEERYKGVWDEGMMSGYCWMLYLDDSTHAHQRKSYAKRF